MGQGRNFQYETTSETPDSLQLSDKFESRKAAVSGGFSLIEILMVVLVIGILCGTGVSMYAGATADSQIRSIKDSLNSFFIACRHRAQMRKTPVTLVYRNMNLGIDQSSSLRLRIPELSPVSGEEINGITMIDDKTYSAQGKLLSRIDLSIILPGQRLATLTMEL